MSNVCCFCGIHLKQKKLFGNEEDKLIRYLRGFFKNFKNKTWLVKFIRYFISFFEFSASDSGANRCLGVECIDAMNRCNIKWRMNKKFFVCSRHFNPDRDYHCRGKKPKLNYDAKPTIPSISQFRNFQLELQKLGEKVDTPSYQFAQEGMIFFLSHNNE